jgi:hypothetical protein
MGWLAVVMDRAAAARHVRLAPHDPVRLESWGTGGPPTEV